MKNYGIGVVFVLALGSCATALPNSEDGQPSWWERNAAGCEALRQNHPAEAARIFRQAVEAAESQVGAGNPETAILLRNLALAYRGEGAYRRAEEAASRSLRILEQALGKEDPALVVSLNVLGEALAEMGRLTEARWVLRRAVSLQLAGPHGELAVKNLAAVDAMEQQRLVAKRRFR